MVAVGGSFSVGLSSWLLARLARSDFSHGRTTTARMIGRRELDGWNSMRDS
jgi:hypothetical protein